MKHARVFSYTVGVEKYRIPVYTGMTMEIIQGEIQSPHEGDVAANSVYT